MSSSSALAPGAGAAGTRICRAVEDLLDQIEVRPAHRPRGARRPTPLKPTRCAALASAAIASSITRAARALAPVGRLAGAGLEEVGAFRDGDAATRRRSAPASSARRFRITLSTRPSHLRRTAQQRAAGPPYRRSAGRARAAPGRFPRCRRRRSVAARARRARYRRCLLESSATAATATAGRRMRQRQRHESAVTRTAPLLAAGAGVGGAAGQCSIVGRAVLLVQAGQVEAGEREARGLVADCVVHAGSAAITASTGHRARRVVVGHGQRARGSAPSHRSPQPMLVKSERPHAQAGMARRGIGLGTVLMPTACAPGVAACGSRPASRTAGPAPRRIIASCGGCHWSRCRRGLRAGRPAS